MKRVWLHRGGIAAGIGIGLMLVLVTWLVYLDGGVTSSYIHFYYIPIVAASYLLGDLGGIVTAFAAALLAALGVGQERAPALQGSSASGGLASPAEAGWPVQDIVVRGILFYFIGLMTSRLFAKLQERREDAASLLEVSRSVNASLRVTAVLRTITETAVNITAAKACSIRLLNRKRDELTAAASYGLSLDYLAKGPVLLADSPLDREVVAGRPVAILDITQDPRFHYRDEARTEGLVSLFCLPLRRGPEVFGVLRVYSASRHQWSRRERRLLQAFAEQAALAIHNARLHEDLRRNYWETVNALARAIEAKDPYTLGHSERVTDYALQLGRALNFSADETETLRFAATLHDIGKIGLTDKSLSRSGHLNVTDEVGIRMHPLIGIAILQPIEFLAPALNAVRYHHERWDGKGYPQGLAGEDIPLTARLLALANLYDSLRTSSPGRPGLSVQDAARALQRAAGKELDPNLTDVFLRALGAAATSRPESESPRPSPPKSG